jgi:hypothetical protein
MIREKYVRGVKHLVVIDIIRECNPSPKPSKIWSEWKKRVTEYPFVTYPHDFESSNGRTYELECVKASDRVKIENLFTPKRKVVPNKQPAVVKTATKATSKVIGKVISTQQIESIFTSLKKCHDEILETLKTKKEVFPWSQKKSQKK